MPRFFVYTPDLPDVLEQRMAVRPKHMERAKPDLDGGINGLSKHCDQRRRPDDQSTGPPFFLGLKPKLGLPRFPRDK
jgi:hypothetical protein